MKETIYERNLGMQRSWLVQRLKKPYKSTILGGVLKDNPFAFGGGLRNGGLSSEAMDLLRDIFTFDYMGAAEFEFGAVPKALNAIVKDSDKYQALSISFPLNKVAKDWRDKSTEDPTGYVEVFVICNRADTDEVSARIASWAFEPYEKTNSLKETTMLSQVLRPYGDWTPDIAGWFELDNGFFFFTDKEMWEKTAELFGITV
jgi:hypothetical protein